MSATPGQARQLLAKLIEAADLLEKALVTRGS